MAPTPEPSEPSASDLPPSRVPTGSATPAFSSPSAGPTHPAAIAASEPMPDAGDSPTLLADGLAVDHPRRPPLAPPTWRKNPVVRLIAFVAITVALVAASALATIGAAKASPLTVPFWQPATLIGATFLAYLIVGHLLEQRRIVELAPSRIGGVLAGLLLGFVLISVVVGVIWALGGLRFSGVQTPRGWVSLVAIAGFQAAISEEILFRGVLFRYVEEVLGTWGAVAISAAVFGGAHLSNPNATILGAVAIAVEAGLLFGAIYALTRSLWIVIGLHFAWNVTMGVLYDIPISGVDASGVLKSDAAGSELISGGAFGIEASVVTLVLLGALALWLLIQVGLRHRAVAPIWVRRRRVRETYGSEPITAG